MRKSVEKIVTQPCRSCGAPIGWLVSVLNRRMPVDPKLVTITTVSGETHSGFIAHFASCPAAKSWRGKKREDPDAPTEAVEPEREEKGPAPSLPGLRQP